LYLVPPCRTRTLTHAPFGCTSSHLHREPGITLSIYRPVVFDCTLDVISKRINHIADSFGLDQAQEQNQPGLCQQAKTLAPRGTVPTEEETSPDDLPLAALELVRMIHAAARSSLSTLVRRDPTALIGRARHQLLLRLDRERRIIVEAATEPYDDCRGAPIETSTSRYPCQLFYLAHYSRASSFLSHGTSLSRPSPSLSGIYFSSHAFDRLL
jgi:hypothetical protein